MVVALVTGSGSGIGKATAVAFAEAGAAVVLVGRREKALQETREMLPDPAAAHVVPADVSDPSQVERAVDVALTVFGRLDAAANCAATIAPHKPIFDMSVEEFDAILNVNLRGLWACVKHEMRAMRATGGAIVNVSSVNAVRGGPLPYATSKAAVEGLTRAAAAEGGEHAIRVNSLRSGAVWTPLLDFATDARGRREDVEERLREYIPLRIGDPAETAAAILWLCSPASSYVTGTCIAVDGGMMTI